LLSGKDLPGASSRDLNSVLLAQFQLSYRTLHPVPMLLDVCKGKFRQN
jgi:hypothetical protein